MALACASCNACHVVHFALSGRNLEGDGGRELREERGPGEVEPAELVNHESLQEQIAVCNPDTRLIDGGSLAFAPPGGSRLV